MKTSTPALLWSSSLKNSCLDSYKAAQQTPIKNFYEKYENIEKEIKNL